jgi:hypothetical protein
MISQRSESAGLPDSTLPANRSWRSLLLKRVQSPRGAWITAAVACALALPSLTLGLTTDDRLNVYRVQRGSGPFTMFELATERLEQSQQMGALSWWTNPQLSIDFLRPLSSLTNWLEYRFYPGAPWAMHGVNVLLYGVLILIAWRLYREFLPNHPRCAAAAALMFAIDDGHAQTVGWISGRNTLLASVFALAALWFHARARTGARDWRSGLASVACVALALCSAEAGLSVFAWLIAYAVAFECGSARSRIVSLIPAAAVFAVWAFVYVSGGYGVKGAGFYRELSTPLATLGAGLADLPIWLGSLVGPSLASVTVLLPADSSRIAFAIIALPLLAALSIALRRTRENQFFALGALLCLPPLFTTLPQDRLLMAASFGAFGLIASFLAVAHLHASRFIRGTRKLLGALHFGIAPCMFILTLDQTAPIDRGARALAAAVPRQAPAQVVFLQLPMELLPMYGWQMLLEEPDRALPASALQLYGGTSPLVVKRIDPQTLDVAAANGWGANAAERMFASLASLPRVGQERTIASVRARVMQSDEEGHPTRVQFQFPDALESNDRLWLSWSGTRPEPWTPPAIGTEVSLPALNAFASLPVF